MKIGYRFFVVHYYRFVLRYCCNNKVGLVKKLVEIREENSMFLYPLIDVKMTGRRIKTLCEEKGLSVKEVQKHLGLACFQTIYSWYSGKSLPSIDNLIVLSRLFDINLESIICIEYVKE